MSDKNNNPPDDSNQEQFSALIADIKNTLSTKLAELISGLLNSSQDRLFDLSNSAENNEDQVRYFELMSQLKMLNNTINMDFNANIKRYLVPAAEFENKKGLESDEDELSLVDQDTMEGIVLVKGIGERAGAKYHEQLTNLQARLEELATKTSQAPKADILTPTSFCQAFDDALGDYFDTTNKKILFNLFDKEVANQLDDVYSTLNHLLIDAEILPSIKFSYTSPTDHGDSSGSSDSAGADAGKDTISQDGSNTISGFAMTATPGASFRQSAQNASQAEDTGAQPGNTGATTSNGNSSSGGGGHSNARSSYYDERPSETDGSFHHQTAGLPADQVSHVLSNFIGAPFTPDTSADTRNNASVYPQSTPQHFGHQEIIDALSQIQNLPQFEHPREGESFDSEAIKQAVLSAIAKSSGGAVTKRINQIAEKTIDFIELIFDAIVDDTNISDTIKALLLRLQIPIIKASMADQEFFIYDDHPARELLDTIASIGVGITEHTDETYKYLDRVVTNILGEYELTTEVFQKALDKLRAYIREQEDEARAIEEAEQQQLLRKYARATVLKSLRATTTGKLLPEATHPLILKRWPTLMFNHYLTKGKENDEWVNIVLTLRQIVESVQPINSAEQLASILLSKDTLFAQTEKYLNAASNSKKDVQAVMSAYKETIQQHIDDANFSEDEVSEAEETIGNAPPEEQAPIEEEVIDRPTIPSNIMPGMWFQIYMGEDRTPRRCKLSVILVEDAKLMFVNHKGELIAEKSFDEFNEELANNTTQIIMGHSAFENAFKTVINRLN
jgi:uncharacterized membrane protein YgcG